MMGERGGSEEKIKEGKESETPVSYKLLHINFEVVPTFM